MQKKNNILIRQIALNGMLMALCVIATLVIQVPINYNGGYVNIGDSIIIIASILFGPLTGFLVGGIGSAIADLFGYASFAVFTLVVKGIEGVIIALIYKALQKKPTLAAILAATVGVLFMVFGYFIVDLILVNNVQTALAGTVFNFIQAGVSLIIGLALTFIVKKLLKTKKSSQDF